MNDNKSQTQTPDTDWFQKVKTFLLPGGRWIWVAIFLIFAVVIGLNIWVGRCYFAQNASLDYFESKAFEAGLASLLIPLLLLLISNAFKINERMETDRKQLEQEKKKIQKQLDQEKKKRQIEAIGKTHSMWSELANLSTEVAYFNAAQSKVPVRDLRKRLEGFTNSAEEVVNLWYLNFPNIPTDVQNMFLPGVNLLLLSAMTITDVIEANESDAAHLQACLLVIQDGVRFGLHYSIMQIFNFSMEGKDAELKNQIAILCSWGDFFKKLIKDQPPNLPPSDSAEFMNGKRKNVQPAYVQYLKAKAIYEAQDEKYKKATDELVKKQIADSEEYKKAASALDNAADISNRIEQEYKDAIIKSPFDALGISRKRIFSNEQIKTFTAEIYFQNDRNKIFLSV